MDLETLIIDMKRRKRKYKLRMSRADLGSMPEALNQPRALNPQMLGGVQGALPWANGMLYWPTLDLSLIHI